MTERKTVRMADLPNKKIISLRLPKDYKIWFNKLPLNNHWWLALGGVPFTGKSSWLLRMCNYFAKDGNILYANFEEKTDGGTIQEKIKMARLKKETKKRIYFLNKSSIDDLIAELDTGKYKYCIIDSVSAVAKGQKAETRIVNLCRGDIELNTGKSFPKVKFISVHHFTKTQKNMLKGSVDFEHIPDIVVWLDRVDGSSVATLKKNRFLGKEAPKQFDIFAERLYTPKKDTIKPKTKRKYVSRF